MAEGSTRDDAESRSFKIYNGYCYLKESFFENNRFDVE